MTAERSRGRAGADLAGADLAGADQTRADLTASDVTASDLTGTDIGRLVSDLCERLFAELDDLREMLVTSLPAEGARRADVAIEARCHQLMREADGLVAGAGWVAARGLLADAPYWLEWWTSDPGEGSAPKRLAAETDPRAVGFRDYTTLPWYAVPLETGARHITGPYVDYVCTDQYTLTFTVPVVREGAFLGVAGADVLVRSFEERLFAPLGRVAGTCAIVNSAGRVVTASDPRWVTGDLIRGLPVSQWWRGEDVAHDRWVFHPSPRLPLGVITAR
jgi:hypothetical protein